MKKEDEEQPTLADKRAKQLIERMHTLTMDKKEYFFVGKQRVDFFDKLNNIDPSSSSEEKQAICTESSVGFIDALYALYDEIEKEEKQEKKKARVVNFKK